MDKKFDSQRPIRAMWCVDSETGERLLIDLESCKVVGKMNADGTWANPETIGDKNDK